MGSGTASSVRIPFTPHGSSGVPITQVADRMVVVTMHAATPALHGRRPKAGLAFPVLLASAQRSDGVGGGGWRHLAVGPDCVCRNDRCPPERTVPKPNHPAYQTPRAIGGAGAVRTYRLGQPQPRGPKFAERSSEMSQERVRRRRRIGIAAALAAGAIGIAAVPTLSASVVSGPGTLEVHKGGYRDIANNSADGFAMPLAGATMEWSTTSSFVSVTPFPNPTDGAGLASASVGSGDYYVREATPPPNWLSIYTLEPYGAPMQYVSTKTTVMAAGTKLAIPGPASTRFVNERVNPTIQTTCRAGLNVLMVIDTSGSTYGFGMDYQNAANAFITQLAGTHTSLKIASFADTSIPGTTPYDLATAAGQSDAQSFVATVANATSGSGLTNWDAALQDAATSNVDVVVFITDGNPTKHQVGTDGLANITYGIASANLAKNPDTLDATGDEQAILAVGVGGGIALNNLKAISGPTVGQDYAVASNPADLEALLKQLATTICPTDVSISKSGPATIAPNGTINYDITVTNSGSGTIPFKSIDVQDPQADTLTPPEDTSDLAAGTSRVWTATKLAGAECGASVSNTATVTLNLPPGYSEPDTSNNSSTATSVITCPTDVAISKAGPATIAPDGTINYDITVTNTGVNTIPFTSINVLDPGANTLTPPVDTTDLAAGTSRVWTATRIAGTVCNSTESNTATVALNLPPGYAPPPETAITSATSTSIVTCPPVVTPAADSRVAPAAFVTAAPASLSVRKLGVALARPGSIVGFRIRVTNTSAVTATNVALTDLPPSAFVIGSTPAGSTRAGHNFTWNLGTIGAGSTKTVGIILNLKANARGTVCNVARAIADNAIAAQGRSCVRVRAAGRPVRVTG